MDESRIDTKSEEPNINLIPEGASQSNVTQPSSEIKKSPLFKSEMLQSQTTSTQNQQTANKPVSEQTQTQPVLQKTPSNKVMSDMISERKKDGYQQFRMQEENINKMSTVHLKVCEQIYTHLNKKAQISENSMNTMILYFKDRLQWETNYYKMLSSKTQPYLNIYKDNEQQPNQQQQQAKLFYPQLSKAMDEFYNLNQKQAQKLNTFIAAIDKYIKEQMETNQSNFTKTIKDFKASFQRLQKNYNDESQTSYKYNQKLLKNYNEMIQNNGTHRKRTKDLFHSEKKFKTAIYNHLKTQEQIGELILSYWTNLLKLDALRVEMIQKGILLFMEKYSEAYSGVPQGGAAVQLVAKEFNSIQPVQECEKAFTIMEILIPVNIGAICNALSLQPGKQLTFTDLKAFLTNYPTSLIKKITTQNHPLILKYFNKIFKDNGTITSSWKRVVIIISLDKNLLIYDSDDGQIPHTKPIFRFTIENSELNQMKSNPLIAELKQTRSGVLFDSHDKIQLKFDSSDEFDELLFYLQQEKQQKQKK